MQLQYPDEPFFYFTLLNACTVKEFDFLCDTSNPLKRGEIRPLYYYEHLSFKTMFCEMIYRAINMFPDIVEYTITTKSNRGTSNFVLGYFEDTVTDDGNICMAKIISDDIGNYDLSLHDIKQLYNHNHAVEVDMGIIDCYTILMHMGGWDPIVKTSFKVANNKNQLVFKNLQN